jgi:hypothetical protein
MKNIFAVAAVAALLAACAAEEAAAADVGGELSIDFAENTAGNWGATTELDLGISAGVAPVSLSLGFDASEDTDLNLDTWKLGTETLGLGVALGNDIGTWVGAEGEQTLVDPTMGTGVAVSIAGAEVAVGTDLENDVTDLTNIRGAYALEAGTIDLTVAGDYNFDSENIVVGAEAAGIEVVGIGLGAAVTYDVDAENIGFEGHTNVMGITAYVNGDQDDVLQNVGTSYDYNLAGITLSGGLNYNLDQEELKPTVGVSFSF